MTTVRLRELVAGDPLTVRQLDVLVWAARGLTARQTAQEMWLAEETVRFHRKLLMAKLDVRNMTRAVVVALSSGLISLEWVEGGDLRDG